MTAYMTRAELALAHLESLKRPLTDEESDQLRRALHAVYCRNRKIRAEREMNAPALAEHEQYEADTLTKICAEVEE